MHSYLAENQLSSLPVRDVKEFRILVGHTLHHKSLWVNTISAALKDRSQPAVQAFNQGKQVSVGGHPVWSFEIFISPYLYLKNSALWRSKGLPQCKNLGEPLFFLNYFHRLYCFDLFVPFVLRHSLHHSFLILKGGKVITKKVLSALKNTAGLGVSFSYSYKLFYWGTRVNDTDNLSFNLNSILIPDIQTNSRIQTTSILRITNEFHESYFLTWKIETLFSSTSIMCW